MRYVLLAILLCGCGVSRREQMKLFEQNKREYQYELDHHSITKADFNELMLGNYEMYYHCR